MNDRMVRLEASGHGRAIIVRGGPDLGIDRRASSVLVRVIDQLLTWQDRARERAHLRDLSDRMMKDMGLSRADIDGESSKPFWRL